MKHILVTGGAGFIGSHVVDALLKSRDNRVTCIDNFDPYYSPTVKRKNVVMHLKNPRYRLFEIDIRNSNELNLALTNRYDAIIHLAAKVGVRSSILNPEEYTDVNVKGTHNMLGLARRIGCKQFVFASSSSVYGVNPNLPWREDDCTLFPISPYAATKIAGELLGHVYASLYGIRFVALRFFAVYGPRQRPDLAIHKFAKLISQNKPIDLYGDGKTQRDYTYIDDIVVGIISSLALKGSQYEIINLGDSNAVELRRLIKLLEAALGKKAGIRTLPEQAGDAPVTFADIRKAGRLLRYRPKTTIEDGLQKFVNWFKSQKLS